MFVLIVPAVTRNDVPNAAGWISNVAGVSRDDVNVGARHRLSGVSTDVETGWRLCGPKLVFHSTDQGKNIGKLAFRKIEQVRNVAAWNFAATSVTRARPRPFSESKSPIERRELEADHTLVLGDRTYHYFAEEPMEDVCKILGIERIGAHNIKLRIIAFVKKVDTSASYKPVMMMHAFEPEHLSQQLDKRIFRCAANSRSYIPAFRPGKFRIEIRIQSSV